MKTQLLFLVFCLSLLPKHSIAGGDLPLPERDNKSEVIGTKVDAALTDSSDQKRTILNNAPQFDPADYFGAKKINTELAAEKLNAFKRQFSHYSTGRKIGGAIATVSFLGSCAYGAYAGIKGNMNAAFTFFSVAVGVECARRKGFMHLHSRVGSLVQHLQKLKSAEPVTYLSRMNGIDRKVEKLIERCKREQDEIKSTF